jgi:hypothetical protein
VPEAVTGPLKMAMPLMAKVRAPLRVKLALSRKRRASTSPVPGTS